MKLFASLLLFVALQSEGQVSFRSDFTVGKHGRKSGLGISMIMVGLGSRWSGPGPRQTLIIDLKAIKYRDQTYSYRQLAERVYGLIPGIPAGHYPQPPVPLFLLMEPSFDRLKASLVPLTTSVPTVKVRRSQSGPGQ